MTIQHIFCITIRVYQQTLIDTYTRVATVKLYDRKNALVAADLLNDRVLPLFEEEKIKLLRILTDRGSEYCGSLEHHEYQLFLALEDIDHTKTKVKSPQTNGIGICERFHRTILDEFYRIALRKKNYSTIAELQADVDLWLDFYNKERPHSGRFCYGKTPWQTWLDSKKLAWEKYFNQPDSFNSSFSAVS
jgi:transposase InsO family protein